VIIDYNCQFMITKKLKLTINLSSVIKEKI
jgi:hypothetical protein